MEHDKIKRKHAYLIMAHDSQELLIMLLKLLDSDCHDFFIHIDRKSESIDENTVKQAAQNSGVTFVKRHNINWGGYSQIETELASLSAAIKNEYSYYHLLSGHDLPLKTAEQIYLYFENSGKNHVNFREKTADIDRRIKYYRFFQEKRAKNNRLWSTVDRVNQGIQMMLHIDRTASLDHYDIAFGSQWFSITHELAHYVCSKKNEIKKIFRFGWCVDELFIQSLIINSEKDWNLAFPPDDHDYHSCMRYIDWTRGSPYVFQREDYQELMESNFMFARKFDLEQDREICDMIYNTLLPGRGK